MQIHRSSGKHHEQCLQTIPHNDLIAHDHVEDHTRGTVIGRSDSGIPTTEFGLLQNAVILQPSSEMQMQLVSDDTGDTQTIRIYYMAEAWGSQFSYVDVVLTGTSTVNTTVSDIYRIEEATIIKGSPAVGTITIKDTGGSDLYGQIDQYTTFMERAIHYIRTGYRTVVTDFIIGTQTKEGVIFRLFKTYQTGTDLVPKGRFSLAVQEGIMSHAFEIGMSASNPDGLRIAVGIGVFGLAASQGATSSFRYYDSKI